MHITESESAYLKALGIYVAAGEEYDPERGAEDHDYTLGK
jgi:hypothetical protein